ncbi:MAG TPA: hypothetical protein VE754_05845 [Actinomycetota bacterium]|jgi:hypothetical protein|nr:hypothetical protein [Actinomycetota bacterium]
MDTEAAARCSVHTDRDAIERCARCGRPVCLTCAIPVRGEVLCLEDATNELEVPAVAVEPAPISRTIELAMSLLLVVALVTTLIPWHRFGILTSVLSAWQLEGGVWPPLTALSALAGATVSARQARRSARRSRRRALGATLLAGTTAVAAMAAVLAAPPYVSHSPAPFVALAASAIATVAGAVGLRRFAA